MCLCLFLLAQMFWIQEKTHLTWKQAGWPDLQGLAAVGSGRTAPPGPGWLGGKCWGQRWDFAADPQVEEPLRPLAAGHGWRPQRGRRIGLGSAWPDRRTRQSVWTCGCRYSDGSDTGCGFYGGLKSWNGVHRRGIWKAWSQCGGACAPSGCPLWRRRCCTCGSWTTSVLQR